MSNHATVSAALLAVFNLDTDKADPAAVADAAANVLVAFADLVRGPAPVPFIHDGALQFAAAEVSTALGTAELICEVRALIEEIRQDRQYNVRAFKKVNGEFVPLKNAGAESSGLPG